MHPGRFQIDIETRKELLNLVNNHKDECGATNYKTRYHKKSCVAHIADELEKTPQAIYRMLKRMRVEAPGPGSGGNRRRQTNY